MKKRENEQKEKKEENGKKRNLIRKRMGKSLKENEISYDKANDI